MKTETQIRGLLEQKKAVLFLKTPRVGLTWEQTEACITAQMGVLEWILEEAKTK